MTRFALTLEFDGRPFMGLQRQAHGPSIQQAVEEAALGVTGERVTLHAAGRTDAGGHALAMRAHLDIARPIAPFRLMAARSLLPHRVRSMVGCLALVGQGKWGAADLTAALAKRNRAALGLNAPPEGLYFVSAIYPGEV